MRVWSIGPSGHREETMRLIVLVVVLLLVLGALPTWGYSSGWGYGPSGLGLLVLIVLGVLLLRKT